MGIKPITYSNGTFPTCVILSAKDLGPREGTLIDDSIEEHGGKIEFPIDLIDYKGALIKEVFFPPFGSMKEGTVIILSQIQSAAQMLLVAIEKFKKGEIDEKKLSSSLSNYQLAAMRRIFGKTGLLSTHILAGRIKRSGRAVVLPSTNPNPLVCIIPTWMAKKFQLRMNDPIIVGRDPTIWDGSLEILLADINGQDDTIRIHPLLYKQLGADNDGDQLWVAAIPHDCHDEARNAVGSFMKMTAIWPVPYNNPDGNVNWDNVKEETDRRTVINGFSIGPEDMLNGENSGAMKELEKITGKELIPGCLEHANGLGEERWKEAVLAINWAQLNMKIGMGPVGAVAMQLRMLAGNNPRLIRSSCLVSERLQQLLLDSKRPITKGNQYDYKTALDVIHNVQTTENPEEAIGKLSTMLGLDKPTIRPIINELWHSGGDSLFAKVSYKYPLFVATTRAASSPLIASRLALRLFGENSFEQSGFAKMIVDSFQGVLHD